jgi:hypothetical protein
MPFMASSKKLSKTARAQNSAGAHRHANILFANIIKRRCKPSLPAQASMSIMSRQLPATGSIGTGGRSTRAPCRLHGPSLCDLRPSRSAAVSVSSC